MRNDKATPTPTPTPLATPVGFGSVAAAAFDSSRGWKHAWAVWLPASLSAALLLIVGVSFFWLSRRIDAKGRGLVEAFEPATQRLTGFQLAFLDEMAAGRAFFLHPAEVSVGELQSKHQRTKRILDSLDTTAERIGPFFVRGLAALHEQLAVWEGAPDTVLNGRLSFQESIRRFPDQERLAGRVISQAAQLNGALSLETQRQVLQMRNLERKRLLLLGALFPLAAFGTALTAWFGRQAIRSERRVLRTAAFEAMLRDCMAALTGAEVLPRALNRIASNAMHIAAADCAFIEQADEARLEVEIVAAAGSGAPATGIRLAFADSLTDALVRAGTSELVVGLENYPANAAPEQWKDGVAMAIPLQEAGDVDGALVLVRHAGVEARAETIARLHSLGVWATVALRRKRLASQLEAERARLETVISEVPVGVVLAEAPSGRIVSLNRKAVELWGSPANPPQAIEEYSDFKVFHPDGEPYQPDQRPLARAILRGEAVADEEAQIERSDGTRSVVRINSAPIRDSRGVISAAVSAMVDITDERQREQRARFLDDISRQLASTLDYDATIQAALQLLVPRMADAASIHHREADVLVRRWDTSGTDAAFDQQFREIERDYPLHLPSAHPVAVAVRTGRSQLHEVVDEELLKTIARTPQELKKLVQLNIRSGMTLPLTVRGKTIGAMQFVSVRESRRYTLSDLALAEEITRRVALAIDNARLFRSVTDNARISKFLSDAALAVSGSLEHDEVLRRVTRIAVPFLADFTLAYLRGTNGHAHHVASAHKDAAKALMLAEAAAQYRPDPDNPGCTVIRALSTGQPVVIEDVTREILDAERFDSKAREAFDVLAPASWMAIPLVARDTTIGAMVFVSTNADRRYRARELRVAQLLAGRAALATQNALLYRKEYDALATRDEVLGIVSHDLRSPLHTIGMSAQVMLEVLGDESQRRRHLQIIIRAKDRMDRLIQDLLDVVRIKGGKAIAIEIRREPVPGLVQETCQQFAESAREKNVSLAWTVPNDTPDVMVDRGRIMQVLSNLIGNALKFTPAGGRIEVGAEPQAESTVRVFVRDTGPGISADNLELVFDAFWQAPRTARLGSGLGLTISRGIVQLHGGRIWAESREGTGSTFQFTLPVAETERQRVAAD
jgi:PAS domain S-box-containing protein